MMKIAMSEDHANEDCDVEDHANDDEDCDVENHANDDEDCDVRGSR